ncbi:MAG: 2'-5' RNA ligase family protein [Chloroflexota bacterium]|nr:MAG: hypothetical protein DIU80_10360 [Chloroflexota bacterium]
MAGQVYAIVSLLRGEARAEVLAIWDLLERRFGMRAARDSIHPHITYIVGDGDDLATLADCTAEAAAATPPLAITLDGLGVFAGPSPVLFMRVVRDQALAATHDRIIEAARCAGLTPWPNYTPDTWVPHITLALRDLPAQALPDVLRALEGQRTRMRTTLVDLRLVRVMQPFSESFYIGTFPLGVSPAA